ncbi:glycoside hydrolase superfamily [Aspergillus caelatus]|uniref:N,O-diacetylmuramidase n=2 Tax=Aspergillus subgen. Circumdati TaxID=2720871 RepID=A0A5N7AJ96_9EURO|nr:glycoside hydrolase superfamily [Aspergillus caelatus]KAE8369962.1 glycoside hydrolase superfamily [Aspergillus caelatus]KAE8419554.1 glycoside hydrolase superfamily [Aspergillus pseudocaelatus]
MKLANLALTATAGLSLKATPETVQGFDISNHQATVDFKAAYNDGARFVMIKATEGTTYKDKVFSSHYQGATDAGMIRGGYHFALPDSSSGAEQAQWFLKNGGGWSKDGITLPGMLDIEYNPYGDDKCYGKAGEAMVAWIKDFVDTYQKATGVYPMIYSTADWWNTCTGNAKGFGNTCPLVLAAYRDSPPTTIPGDWATYTIWQNSDSYKHGGDSDIFNGGYEQLQKIANAA